MDRFSVAWRSSGFDRFSAARNGRSSGASPAQVEVSNGAGHSSVTRRNGSSKAGVARDERSSVVGGDALFGFGLLVYILVGNASFVLRF